MRDSVPPIPEGAQVSEEEWAKFYDQFAHARVRRAVRMVSRLPSAPRCEACGSPYKGIGGVLMRMTGKAPSRKNPRWCKMCFEAAPDGGATLTIGVLFADVRNSTSMAEQTTPKAMAGLMNRFYGDVTKVIVQHGIVDKLIGDEVMGLYFPALSPEGRYLDAMYNDARAILAAVGYGSNDGPRLEVGIGLDFGPAFVGVVGEGEVRDFTAIGDVVNIAARLQGFARGGQIVMAEEIAAAAGVDEGESIDLELKGKAERVAARVVSVA